MASGTQAAACLISWGLISGTVSFVTGDLSLVPLVPSIPL